MSSLNSSKSSSILIVHSAIETSKVVLEEYVCMYVVCKELKVVVCHMSSSDLFQHMAKRCPIW